MGANSKIEWTDATWNPIRGCSMAPGSEAGGCLNCYAARMAARGLPGLKSPTTGEPFAVMRDSGPRWTGKVELIESEIDRPFHWRKPKRIFVNSTSDTFHPDVTDDQLLRLFTVAGNAHIGPGVETPHTLIFLTKRAQRMLSVVSRLRWDVGIALTSWAGRTQIFNLMARLEGQTSPWKSLGGGGRLETKPAGWMPPNIWLGVSVETQVTADQRVPLLLQTPAAVHFVSAEPLLGPLNLWPYLHRERTALDYEQWADYGKPFGWSAGVRWVICGGESGPGARPMQTEWARSLRDQCQAADTAFFFKQWGEHLGAFQDGGFDDRGSQLHNCSFDPIRVGKRLAGRLLDGREWNEFPEVRNRA